MWCFLLPKCEVLGGDFFMADVKLHGVRWADAPQQRGRPRNVKGRPGKWTWSHICSEYRPNNLKKSMLGWCCGVAVFSAPLELHHFRTCLAKPSTVWTPGTAMLILGHIWIYPSYTLIKTYMFVLELHVYIWLHVYIYIYTNLMKCVCRWDVRDAAQRTHRPVHVASRFLAWNLGREPRRPRRERPRVPWWPTHGGGCTVGAAESQIGRFPAWWCQAFLWAKWVRYYGKPTRMVQ